MLVFNTVLLLQDYVHVFFGLKNYVSLFLINIK